MSPYYFSDNFKSLVNKPNKEYFRLEGNSLNPIRQKPLYQEFKDKQILVFRSPGLGDLIMTTPLIRALKKAVPSCSITLLTSSQAEKIAPLIPNIEDVITFDTPWEKLPFSQNAKHIQSTISKIRQGKFDVGIILTVVGQDPLPTALVMYLAGVPRRIAYSRYKPYQLLTDWIPDYEPDRFFRHEVDRELELLKTLGLPVKDKRMQLQISTTASSEIRFTLKQQGVDLKRKLVVCHIGSTDIKRIYPAAGFLQVGQNLTKLGYQIIFTGVKEESFDVEWMVNNIGKGAFNLAGVLNLPQLCGLIKRCDLLISNNTAPVHIASSLGTPVLDLYARTNPQHTPWFTKHQVLYFDALTENRNKILKQLPPELIIKQALKMLSDLKSERNIRYAQNYNSHTHV